MNADQQTSTRRNNVDAERALLATVLVEPRAIPDVEHLAPEDMWHPAHEELWRMILAEHRAGRPVDPVLLSEDVRTSERDTRVNPLLIAELTAGMSEPAVKAPHFARLIADTAQARRVQDLAQRLLADAGDANLGELEAVLDRARGDLDKVASASAGVEVRTIADLFEEALVEWAAPEDVEVYPTGWPELDDLLGGGWKPGQLTVLGARPAVGKSVVACCAAVAAHEYGAGLFSLEMTDRELMARMVAAEVGVDLGRLNDATQLTEEDWRKIMRMRGAVPDWRVFVESTPRRSAAQVKATVRSWQRRGPVPLVVVDYLQLMTPADTRDQRERQVARLAEDLKIMAKELNVHVVALAQVNRGSTQREDKRPAMSDLRESGGIEAHADNVILLHRPEDGDGATLEFGVAKNRHGATATLELAWRPNVASVNSYSPTPAAYPFGGVARRRH